MMLDRLVRGGIVWSALALMACASGGGARGAGGSQSGGAGGVAGAGGFGGAAGAGGLGGSGGTGPPCYEEPCQLVPPQCGCEDGERCHFDGDGPVCVPDGDKELSQSCNDDCKKGMLCWDAGLGAGPICHDYCYNNDQCDLPGGMCLLEVGGMTPKLCTHNCDPISATGCFEPEHKCDFFKVNIPSEPWITQCTGAGTATQGQPCNTTADCAKGMGCILTPEKLCLTWCNYGMPACPAGTCLQLNPPLILGDVEYGACL